MTLRTQSMGCGLAAALLLCAVARGAFAEEPPVELKPGAVFSFTIHALPKTLYEMHTGRWSPATATVRLPDNYNTTDAFPLLVFLNGGDGGDCKSVGDLPAITGGRDYIVAVLPLFQVDMLDTRAAGGLLITHDDYAVMAPAYRGLLGGLRERIPNIRYAGSTLGGFSNGGHTMAALIDHADADILRTFENFFIVDGGFTLTRVENLKGHNLLFMHGGKDEGRLTLMRRYTAGRILARAYELSIRCEIHPMPEIGHAFPASQYPVVADWLKRMGEQEAPEATGEAQEPAEPRSPTAITP